MKFIIYHYDLFFIAITIQYILIHIYKPSMNSQETKLQLYFNQADRFLKQNYVNHTASKERR